MTDFEEYMDAIAEVEDKKVGEHVMETLKKEETSYQLEIYLSTDGKHTVNIKAPAGQGLEALSEASKIYDGIVEKYGLKPTGFQKTAPKPQGPTVMCPIHNVVMPQYTSKRTGGLYNGHFIKEENRMCIGKERQ